MKLESKRQFGRAALLQMAIAAILVPTAAIAAGETDDTIGEVVVTAQKRVQKLNDVGLTVTAISGDNLKDRQLNSLADLASAVPGLSYTNSGSNTPVYTLRGVGFYETTLGAYPDVSVYVDEAPLPFPVLTTLTAFDLERVEVLKGPQGTLFGNNATGGAINYIAAKPTDEFSSSVTLGFGRFDAVSAEGYVSGPVSDKLKMRLSGKVLHAGDWQKGYTNNDTTGKTGNFAVRLLADWQPTDALRVQVNLNGWKDTSDPQAVQFIQYRPNFPGSPSIVSTYPLAPENPRAADFTASIDPSSDNKLWNGVVRLDYDLTDNLALTSVTSYVDYQQDMAYDGDGVTYRDFDVQSFLGDVSSFSQEIRLANSPKNSFRWVVGANYADDKAADDYILVYRDSTVFSGAGIETSGFRSDQKMKNYAAFASVENDVGAFTLKAGVRYTKAERDVNSCFYSFAGPSEAAFAGLYQFLQDLLRAANGLPPGPPVSGQGCLTIDTEGLNGNPPTYIPGAFEDSLNQSNVSWRVGADWKANDDTLVYFNVTKGFKAGSFPSAAAATTTQLLGVTQESVLSYEGGVKATLLDGKLQANAAAFFYDYKDKQLRSKLLDPIFGVLDALVNIPKTEIMGLEVELNARPTDGLTLYANAVYLDTEIKEFVGLSGEGVAGDFAGERVPYAPKFQVAAGGEYTWPLSNGMAMFGAIDVSYRTKTTAIIAGSAAYDIDAYELVDLRFGVRSGDDRWRAQVWAKNITNSYYWTNVASYYDTVARYAGRPATYGASVTFNFGK